MTVAWEMTADDYLRLDCESDAREVNITYADEPCALCGGDIPEQDEVISHGKSFHSACAEQVFGE